MPMPMRCRACARQHWHIEANAGNSMQSEPPRRSPWTENTLGAPRRRPVSESTAQGGRARAADPGLRVSPCDPPAAQGSGHTCSYLSTPALSRPMLGVEPRHKQSWAEQLGFRQDVLQRQCRDAAPHYPPQRKRDGLRTLTCKISCVEYRYCGARRYIGFEATTVRLVAHPGQFSPVRARTDQSTSTTPRVGELVAAATASK